MFPSFFVTKVTGTPELWLLYIMYVKKYKKILKKGIAK